MPIDRQANPRDLGSGKVGHEIVVNEKTAGARRRSIYLEHCRGQLPTLLALFDTPIIATNCIERTKSTVPVQSLAQLNSEFMRLRAKAMADRLKMEAGSDLLAQICRAFILAYGRLPTLEEQQEAQQFIEVLKPQYPKEQAEVQALVDFCQMLLCSNSFLYIE